MRIKTTICVVSIHVLFKWLPLAVSDMASHDIIPHDSDSTGEHLERIPAPWRWVEAGLMVGIDLDRPVRVRKAGNGPDLDLSDGVVKVENPDVVLLSDGGNDISIASQWRLILYRFRRHELAMAGGIIQAVFYSAALFAPFVSPYDPYTFYDDFANVPPQRVRLLDENGFSIRPFYHALTKMRNMLTLKLEYEMDTSRRIYLSYFTKGSEDKIFGLMRSSLHLFGNREGMPFFLFGSDMLG